MAIGRGYRRCDGNAKNKEMQSAFPPPLEHRGLHCQSSRSIGATPKSSRKHIVKRNRPPRRA
jgi:hypothetical protein